MAASVKTSGSQTATISTEHDLATVTDAGTYGLIIDMNALVGGTTPDIVEIREYTKARSSDTERLSAYDVYVGGAAPVMHEGVVRLSPHHRRYTLKQTQGTGRAFPWAINQT